MVLRQPAPVTERPLALEDRPTPLPGRGEVRLHIRRCAVCHTDLHIVEGDLPLQRSPIVPGHQVVGIVDALGEGVTEVALGDRVGVAWFYAACGQCVYCRSGHENLCVNAQFTGYHVDGGYAEALVARADYVYPIPTTFSDTDAAPLLCAGIIGFRSLRRADVRPGDRIGLFGFGASAHLALQIARHWGCEVSVFTRTAAHRQLAERLGAAWVGAAGDRPPDELDSAIVFAPSSRVVIEALKTLRRGGTLAINAIHLDQLLVFDYGWLYWERTVRSVSNSTRQDGRDFLELAAKIPIRVETELMPLDEANQALLALKRAEIRGAAVLEVR